MQLPRSRIALLGLALIAGTSCVFAQTPLDAGALQQQIEKQLPRPIPGESRPLAPLPAEMPPNGSIKVTVKAFRFAGNKLLGDEQLALAVEPFLNRPLDFAGLQLAAAAVSDAYRRAGWIVRVYLPRQDITKGIVTLQIVEAVFGRLRIEGTPPSRLNTDQAQAIVATAQPSGHVLDTAKLDRALLLLDDLPGVAASGNLAAGRGQAETDLILKLTDEPLLNGEVGLDNTGARATGSVRGTANAYLNSPLKRGDLATANLLHSDGSDYLRFAYSLPVGHDGMRLGVSGSYMDYKVVSDEFKALDLEGTSKTLGFDLQYPLIRARARNLYIGLGLDDKRYENRANGATTSDYRVRNVNISLNGNLFDRLGGGGASLASLSLTLGDLDLGALDSNENAALDGRFTKLRYLLSRQQVLTDQFSLYAALSGQLADSNLDSSEKFYLGGSTGVRAYPANEGGGSDATLLNLELRWRVMNNLLLSGLYDWGRVSQNHDNNVTSPANPNSYALRGAGASITWTGPKGITLKGVYAHRIGDNPNATTNGDDQDGTLIKHRLWFTASLPF